MGHSLIYDRMPDGSQLTNPKATSHYLWNAVQRRALSYLLSQKEVDKNRVGAKGYSYGGTIMWNLGMDERVKAVVAILESVGSITSVIVESGNMHYLPGKSTKHPDRNSIFQQLLLRLMLLTSKRPAYG